MVAVDGMEVVRDTRKALEGLKDDKLIAIDIETTGLRPFADRIATVQLYGDSSGTLALLQYPNGVLPRSLTKFLSSPDHTLIAHNGVSFDGIFLQQAGVDYTKPRWYDTLVAETVLDISSRRDRSVSLRASVKRRLGTELDKDIDHGGWAGKLDARKIEYAVRDVLHLPALMRSQQEKVAKLPGQGGLTLEMEILPVVMGMIVHGIPISLERTRTYIQQMSVEIEEVLPKLRKVLPGVLNFDSPIQIRRNMGELGIEVKDTRKETLQELALFGGFAGEVAQLVLDYRSPRQRLKMYDEDWLAKHVVRHILTEGYEEGVFDVEHRVHARFWQCGTDTGRFSCTDPNMQQVPKKEPGAMRFVFGNLDGFQIVASDYSQIEIAIAAALFNDAALMDAVRTGDVHTNIAAYLYNVSPENVTYDMRRMAKAGSFTLLFGGGSRRLYEYAKTSGSTISPQEAQEFVSTFFRKFVGLQQARQTAIRIARRRGPVIITMPSGLRRMLVGYKKTMTRVLNTPVQGTAAVGMKNALRLCAKRGLARWLSLTVHDELVATVPTREAKDFAVALEEAMIDGMHEATSAVARVNTRIGDTW